MEKPKLVSGSQTAKVNTESAKTELQAATSPKGNADQANKVSAKPEAQGLTQREAVYIEVMRLIRDEKIVVNPKQAVKPLLNDSHVKKICLALAAGFQAKKFALKETDGNKKKLADAKAMEVYCLGLLNNWLRRDLRLNGNSEK